MRKRSFVFLLVAYSTMLFGVGRVSAIAQTIYVSSTMGDDTNDGRSPLSPIRTISLASTKGDTLLLKSGDVFYGRQDFIRKHVSRYGEGHNPVISGYRRIEQPSWEQVQQNVWRLYLIGNAFSGVTFQGSSMLNNIGCFHEYDKDIIHAHRVEQKSQLKKDWDFWQTDNYKNATEIDFDYVYLYLTVNPNNLQLEYSTGSSGSMVQESTVDGINIRGFGKHGIAAKTQSIIRNCWIDAIGGMLFVGYTRFCCYGNGIEFYVNKDIDNAEVSNCLISRCYDSGLTIQASGHGRCQPRNIHIHHNLVSHCCQAWEDFLCNDEDIVYFNCSFDNNVIVYSGDSGFEYSEDRFKYCNVLGGNSKGDRGMIIRDNLFIGGNYYCSSEYKGRYTSNIWQNNTLYTSRDCYLLGNQKGTKDVLRIPKTGTASEVIAQYRHLTGDLTTHISIKSHSYIRRRSKREYKKFLKQHKY